jgi:hypothetical protein
MDHRDQVIHSKFLQQQRAGDWVPVRTHLKSEHMHVVEGDALERVRAELESAERDAMRLAYSMWPQLRVGVFIPVLGPPMARNPLIVKQQGDSYPARPTEDERRRWLSKIGRGLVSEYRARNGSPNFHPITVPPIEFPDAARVQRRRSDRRQTQCSRRPRAPCSRCGS